MPEQLIKIVASGKMVEIKASIGKMVFANFLSGMAWGLGTVIGATFVLAFLLFILSQLDTAPLIGDYISDILNYVQNTSLKR